MSGATAPIAHRTATASGTAVRGGRPGDVLQACRRSDSSATPPSPRRAADVDTVDAETGQRDEPLEHAVAGVDGAQLPLDRGRRAPDIPASSSRNRSRSGPLSATVMLAVVEKASWLPASSAERRARSMRAARCCSSLTLSSSRTGGRRPSPRAGRCGSPHAPPPRAAAAAHADHHGRHVGCRPTRCRTPPGRSDRRRTPALLFEHRPADRRRFHEPLHSLCRRAEREAHRFVLGRYQPVPRPSSARPPEIRSMVATAWAHSAG